MNEDRLWAAVTIVGAILFFPITIPIAIVYGLLTLLERLIHDQ